MAEAQHFDVIVVGGGNAALCAALSAQEAGAKVAVLEAAPKQLRGGNSRFASACFRVVHNGMSDIEPLVHPDNKYLVKRARLAPFTRQRYLKEFEETSKGHFDKALVEVLLDQSLSTVQWMRDKGVRWTIALSKFFTEEQITREVVDINPGLCLMAEGEGIGLTNNLWAAVERTDISVFYGTPAADLITSGERVRGVRARQKDQFVDFYGQVILGCGGFEASPRLRRQFLGEGWDLVCVRGTRFNTGTMLEKTITAGAGVAGHWGGCHAVPMDINSPKMGDLEITDKMSRYSYPFAIMVNKDGKRFMDEGRDTFELTYAATGDLIGKQRDSTAYQIFDQKSIITLEPRYSTGTPIVAESLEELAQKLDIDSREFLKTVREFNAAVPATPEWDPFHKDGRSTGDKLAIPKTNWCQTVDQGPFVAYAVTCGE